MHRGRGVYSTSLVTTDFSFRGRRGIEQMSDEKKIKTEFMMPEGSYSKVCEGNGGGYRSGAFSLCGNAHSRLRKLVRLN